MSHSSVVVKQWKTNAEANVRITVCFLHASCNVTVWFADNDLLITVAAVAAKCVLLGVFAHAHVASHFLWRQNAEICFNWPTSNWVKLLTTFIELFWQLNGPKLCIVLACHLWHFLSNWQQALLLKNSLCCAAAMEWWINHKIFFRVMTHGSRHCVSNCVSLQFLDDSN